MKIILKGRIPSKKNSKRMIFSRGSPRLISSAAYLAWQREQSYLLKKLKQPITKGQALIIFYAPDNRSADLTNKAESIMDLLVDNNILLDDNWFVVMNLTLNFMGVDKKDPRAEVDIWPR